MPPAPGGTGTPPATATRGTSSPPPPYLPSRQPPSVPRSGEPNRRERNRTEPSRTAAVPAPLPAALRSPLRCRPCPAAPLIGRCKLPAARPPAPSTAGAAQEPAGTLPVFSAVFSPSCLFFFFFPFFPSHSPFLSPPLPSPPPFFLSPFPSAAAAAVGGAGTRWCACGRARCSRKQTRGLPVRSPTGHGWHGLVTRRFPKLRAPGRRRSSPGLSHLAPASRPPLLEDRGQKEQKHGHSATRGVSVVPPPPALPLRRPRIFRVEPVRADTSSAVRLQSVWKESAGLAGSTQ